MDWNKWTYIYNSHVVNPYKDDMVANYDIMYSETAAVVGPEICMGIIPKTHSKNIIESILLFSGDCSGLSYYVYFYNLKTNIKFIFISGRFFQILPKHIVYSKFSNIFEVTQENISDIDIIYDFAIKTLRVCKGCKIRLACDERRD